MRYKHILHECFVYPTYHGGQGQCQIEGIEMKTGQPLIVITETKDNPGMSITNAAECVATAVARFLGLDRSDDLTKVVWVEHYGYPDTVRPERPRSFDRVTFAEIDKRVDPMFRRPSWHAMLDSDWAEFGVSKPATSGTTDPLFINQISVPQPAFRFPLGECVITSGAKEKLVMTDASMAICRHAKADWGELCADDVAENERSLIYGGRLFSVYRDRNGVKFYVITEADRSVTTVLLPEEY